MNPTFSLLALTASITLATACDNTVEVSGLDLELEQAEKVSAWFATDGIDYDTDGDGVDDRKIYWTQVVVSDDDDLCSRIDTASDLGSLTDISAVILSFASSSSEDNATLTSSSSLSDVLSYGGTWGGARVLERRDGVTLVDVYSDSVMDGWNDEVTLDINGSSGDAPDYATISATYAADVSVDMLDGAQSGRAEGGFFLANYCGAFLE